MNVMLSYQRTDIVFANKLTTYLRRAGFPPWHDGGARAWPPARDSSDTTRDSGLYLKTTNSTRGRLLDERELLDRHARALFTHDARARLLKNEPPRLALVQPLPPEVDA